MRGIALDLTALLAGTPVTQPAHVTGHAGAITCGVNVKDGPVVGRWR